jgi:hypothetical protein
MAGIVFAISFGNPPEQDINQVFDVHRHIRRIVREQHFDEFCGTSSSAVTLWMWSKVHPGSMPYSLFHQQ